MQPLILQRTVRSGAPGERLPAILVGMHPYAEAEAFFDCPFCGERISMLLELASGGQSYVEDCEVCCQPIRLRYCVETDDEGMPALAYVDAEPAA